MKHCIYPQPWRRSCALLTTLLTIVLACVAGEPRLQAQQTPLRKIGELDLAIRGLIATTDATQTLPKSTASGVRVTIRAGAQELTLADAARFLGGPFAVAGELSGPGLPETQALRSDTSDKTGADPFLLRIPALPTAGNYTLANLRVVREVRNPLDETDVKDVLALDVAPRTVTLNVLDQILITSVTTRALTLDEIKARGIVLTSDDYKGFEFTIGMKLESKPVTFSFPAIFDHNNIAVPQPLVPPQVSRESVPVPLFVPVLLQPDAPTGGGKRPPLTFDGGPEITIPSVLVIPGNVGYLDQFFSAQLFVANGAPIGTPLTVHSVTGKITLPTPADPDHPPLKLALTETGVHDTLPVRAVGLDGQPGTPDDVDGLNPGEQGQAEFLVQAKEEGFYTLKFDIHAELEGLPVGPIGISGAATGAVLVRNPYYDMTFTLPSVVRADEPFTMFATITNIGKGIGNDVTISLDEQALSHLRIDGDRVQHINTLMPGDAATIEYRLIPEVTGKAVATYLKFDGATGRLRFTVGVDERNVPLSPDTLVLPSVTDRVPQDVVRAAMRLLGQAYSAANAPAGTLPPGIIRPGKDVVTQKALALAEAGLRITLGQETPDAMRDLAADFYLGLPKTTATGDGSVLPTARFDGGWDQVLRTTDAGWAFARALGVQLDSSGGALAFERAVAQVQTSGPDFASFAVDTAAVDIALKNAAGATTVSSRTTTRPASTAVTGAGIIPLGTDPNAPVLGLITSLTGSPFTLSLTGRGNGATALSLTLPRGDGTFLRGSVSGIAVTSTWRGRVTLDLSQPDHLLLDQDADGDGTFETQTALATEQLQAQGARLISANVIGPEVIDGAAPWGQNAVLVFDRMVDAASAADKANYQIPLNGVIGAKAVMSQRVVLVSLDQPEGPWVPSTMAANGVHDGRGVARGGAPVTLGSLLRDPGAVVSGHVYFSDGTPYAGGAVIYLQNPNYKDCQTDSFTRPFPVSRVVLDNNGHYELRYVRRDNCGFPFTIETTDPATGAVMSTSRYVRSTNLLPTPERIIADIALFGHGNVTGVVRDLQGHPVAGANVAVASVTDGQVGGLTTTDANGRYTVTGVTVGVVSVSASKGTSAGHSGGRIERAGLTAQVDVTLDGGSVTVEGTVTTIKGGVSKPADHVVVAYLLPGGSDVPVGYNLTDAAGHYILSGMPLGAFKVEATLDAFTRQSVDGTAAAGDHQTKNIQIVLPETGTITGIVQLSSGQGVANAFVFAKDRATTTKSDGTFTLENIPLGPSIQVTAITSDESRNAMTFVDVLQSNSPVPVALVLSGLAKARFTVVDGNLRPLSNVLVTRLDCSDACGCGGQYTDALGQVTFDNAKLGGLAARAFRTGDAIDTANGNVLLVHDGDIVDGTIRLNGFGTITGRVLDGDDLGIFGADVEVFSNHYVNDGFTCGLTPGTSHHIRTDKDGRFRIPNVNIGTVTVRASQAFMPTLVTGEKGTLARAGDTVDFTLHLVDTMSGVLSGTVFLPDGVTPAGAGVEVTTNGVLPDVTVRTDSEGKYHFAKILPEGTYTLTASDPLTGGVQRTAIFLHKGQDATYDLRLKGRGMVRVLVRDGAGVPVSDAHVVLTETGGYPANRYERAILPDDQGYAIFPRVYEGSITVEAFDARQRGGRASTNVSKDGATVDVTISLTPTGTVTGRVLQPDRTTPIALATVNLLVGGRLVGQATTDSGQHAGEFTFDYVPVGPFRLEMIDPDSARTGVATGTVPAQDEKVIVDVIAQALGTVSGTVTGTEGIQRGALVTLQSGTFRIDTITDALGQFSVTGVPEGLVIATAALDTADFLRGTASGTLSGEGSSLVLNVALRASGHVNGLLQNFDGTLAPPALITIEGSGTGGGRQQVSTEPDGTFAFARVPTGAATITATVLDGIDQGRTVVQVPENDTATVTLKLIGVASVRVQATDSVGHHVAGKIYISSAPSAPFPYERSVDTDADGLAVVKDLLAGDVTVRLYSNASATPWGTATATIAPGVETPITVKLQPSARVIGRVLRPDGTTPAVGTDIDIYPEAYGRITVTADQDGRFEAIGVPLGRYSVNLHDKLSNGYAFVPMRTFDIDGGTDDLQNIVLDDSAVTVASIDPAPGATNVSVTKTVVLTFSDRIDNVNGIYAVQNGAAVYAVVRLQDDRQTVTITPGNGGQWLDDKTVDVIVPATIIDIFGRPLGHEFHSQFRTQDLTPPSVSSITPADGAIQVDPATPIVVTFSEPIAASNLASVVTVTAVSGAASGSITGVPTPTAPNVITFTPDANLPPNTRYTVTVNHAIDLSGNEQTVASSATFTTPDTIAPALSLISPPNGGKTNKAQPVVRIDFGDAASGVDLATLHVAVDSHDYTATATTSAGSASFTTIALVEGVHTVTASIADRAGNVGTLSATFTVEFDPVGSVTGHLRQPDGSPAVGLSVQLTDGTTTNLQQTTDASGAFRFDDLPLFDSFSVTAKNAFGRVRARNTSVILLRNRGEVIDVSLTLAGEGGVTGRVFDPDGQLIVGAHVNVQSNPPTLSQTSVWLTTDATGAYQLDTLPEGPVAVSSYVDDQPWRGNNSGSILRDQTITLDIHLAAPTPIYFPVTRLDANNYHFNLDRTGSSNSSDFLLDIVANGVPTRFEGTTDAQLTQNDRELVLHQTNVAGLDVTRKIFVPNDGYFARYVERLTNTSGAPVTVDLRVTSTVTALRYDERPDIMRTSSGDTNLDVSTPATADRWLTIDDATDGETLNYQTMPVNAFLMDGAGGASHVGAATFGPRAQARDLVYEWQQVTIPPGETVSLLHFGVFQPTRAGGEAAMRRLEQLPPEALTGLEPIDLTSIRNFVVPQDGVSVVEPLGSLTNTITGHVFGGDGATPVANADITFRSLHPLFGRPYALQSNGQGAFTIVGYIGLSGSRPVPQAPFELQAQHHDTDRTSPVVNGTFAENETTATVDITLAGTGVISGTVLGFDGQPRPNTTVTVYYGGGYFATQVTTDQAGHYAATGLWPRDFTVVATFPHPQGTAITAEAVATVTADTVTQVDLAAVVGNVTGTIRDTNGAPVAGLQLTLGNYWNASWATRTDAAGIYTFTNVAAGSFPLNAGIAVDPLTPTVTVVANQVTTQDFTFLGTGTVTVTVQNATGTPAVSASVYLIEQATGSQRYLGYTDSNGVVTGSNIKLGSYNAKAYDPSNSQFFSTAPVALTQNGQSVSVTVTLPELGMVTGRVTFPDGSLATGTSLRAWPTATPGTNVYTYTSSGIYTFATVWANTPLTVEAENGTSKRSATTSVATGATQTLDIVLPAQATVQVHVQRGDTSPLRAVQLRLDRDGATDYATTDGNGDATFWNVPEGAFTVRNIHGQGTVSGAVTAADHRHTIALTITESAMSRLTVGVTAGDGVLRIPNSTVTVYDADSEEYIGQDYFDGTNDVVINVPASHNLRVYASAGYDLGYVTSDNVMVMSAAADQNTTLSIALPLAVITGHVTYADGSALTATPAVSIMSADGTNSKSQYGTTADGGFLLLAPWLTDFVVTAQDPDSGLRGTATGTIASFSTPIVADVHLQPSGTVTGTVRDVNGNPVANATVGVISAGLDFPRQTQSAANGTFTLTHIALGELTAQAAAGTQRASNIGKLESDGQPITVDLAFPATGAVEGVVTDANGQPAANMPVKVQAQALHGSLGTATIETTTDNNGAYHVDGVPVGAFFVGAGSPYTYGQSHGLVTGELTVAGGTATINVALGTAYEAGIWSLVFNNGGGSLLYDFGCNGEILHGGTYNYGEGDQPWFDGAASLRLYGTKFPCATEVFGSETERRIAFGPNRFGELIATRQTYVNPSLSYARYLETITNPTDHPISLDVIIRSKFVSYGYHPVTTTPDSTSNRYVVAGGSGFVLAGATATTAPAEVQVSATAPDAVAHYPMTIAPGQTISLLHFLVQADADTLAPSLATLSDPDALTGLTPQQRATIVNFVIP